MSAYAYAYAYVKVWTSPYMHGYLKNMKTLQWHSKKQRRIQKRESFSWQVILTPICSRLFAQAHVIATLDILNEK